MIDSISSLKHLWPTGDGLATRANGASSGLLTWWDNEKFSLQITIENKNWLFVKLENKENKEAFWVGNIYGPTAQAQKETFWNSLEEQRYGKKKTLWFIACDFNVIVSADERKGGVKVRDPFGERLEDLASQWGLTDIKPKNGVFTWSNKRIGPGHIATRLDRVLVSTHLLRNLPFPESKLLCSAVSDHKPLCLFFPPVENLGPLPFRFNHLCLESEGVQDIIFKA